MSKLRNEIKACMSGLSREKPNTLIANFCFPPEFIGFQGHFPDKPVLPGVCKIQAALLMFEEFEKKSVRLKEISSAKFFSPVISNQQISISLEELQDKDKETLFKARVTSQDKKVAELNLKVIILE